MEFNSTQKYSILRNEEGVMNMQILKRSESQQK